MHVFCTLSFRLLKCSSVTKLHSSSLPFVTPSFVLTSARLCAERIYIAPVLLYSFGGRWPARINQLNLSRNTLCTFNHTASYCSATPTHRRAYAVLLAFLNSLYGHCRSIKIWRHALYLELGSHVTSRPPFKSLIGCKSINASRRKC